MSTPQSDTPLAIDISVCIHEHDIHPEHLALFDGPTVPVRALRRLDDGSLRSGIVDLPAGWACPGAATPLSATVQMFVRAGTLRIGDTQVRDGAFAVWPAGQPTPRMTALTRCDLIVIFDAPGGAPAADAVLIADCFAIEPFTPVIAGKRLDGFERRVLWVDPVTGADTRLLRIPAGFRGGGPNWHPVNEEIFCLAGDIEPDDTRPMRAGSFLWNPACSVHGFDEQTVGGCVLLEWHDGAWALTPAPGTRRPAIPDR